MITKEKALEAYGNKPSALARALGVGNSSVSNWPPGEPIPDRHVLALAFILKPEVFKKEREALKSRGKT